MNFLDAMSSSEVTIREHLKSFSADAIDAAVGDLRTRQAFWFANALDESIWNPPVFVKCIESNGTLDLVELTSLVDKGILSWSNQECVFKKTNARDSRLYIIDTSDADLIEMIDYLEIPDAVRKQLSTHLDGQQLCPRVRAAILDSVRKDEPPIFRFESKEPTVSYTAAAAGASCTESLTEIFLEVSGGAELRVLRKESEDVWPAVLRIVSGPQANAANAVIELWGRRIQPVQPFDKFGIGKVRREDVERPK